MDSRYLSASDMFTYLQRKQTESVDFTFLFHNVTAWLKDFYL